MGARSPSDATYLLDKLWYLIHYCSKPINGHHNYIYHYYSWLLGTLIYPGGGVRGIFVFVKGCSRQIFGYFPTKWNFAGGGGHKTQPPPFTLAWKQKNNLIGFGIHRHSNAVNTKKKKKPLHWKMDQTKRPLLIPPEFSTYAEEHGIFDMYKVCTLHSLSQLKSVKMTRTQIKQALTTLHFTQSAYNRIYCVRMV